MTDTKTGEVSADEMPQGDVKTNEVRNDTSLALKPSTASNIDNGGPSYKESPFEYTPVQRTNQGNDEMKCECGAKMYDNRHVKDGGKGRYPKTRDTQPDWKCSNKACGKTAWLEKYSLEKYS